MRFFALGLAALALTGCHHAPQPVPHYAATPASLIGLSPTDWRRSCERSMGTITNWGQHSIGECFNTPDQYVEFRDGVVVAELNTDDLVAVVSVPTCDTEASDPAQCRSELRNTVAIDESRRWAELNDFRHAKQQEDAIRQAQAKADRNARLSAALAGAAASITANQPSFQPGAGACLHRSDYVSGFNRICNYDCTGSAAATTIPNTSLCPMTIQR